MITAKPPTHVGLILDGNRRWAKAHGKSSLAGHKAGYDNFYKIGRYLLSDKKIPFVSAYVFSIENWNRSKREVNYLMKLVSSALIDYLGDFHKEGIKIIVVGSRLNLSKSVINVIEKAESTTKNNKNGTLALCFNYGGQQEIADAMKQIIESGISPNSVDKNLLSRYMYKPDLPPIDLIIRTSGEHRLSGFMLWRSAYAELYFSEKYWPDFTTSDTDDALEDYLRRQRRFGA